MANQSPDRREVLRLLARVGAVSQFPGFSRWVYAAGDREPASSRYVPLFFTPDEFKLVDDVSELIIPRDEHPGARDAGVAEFIDFMVAHEEEDVQFRFRTGIGWLNAFALENHGGGFCALEPTRQEELVARLAIPARRKPTEVQGQDFFKLIRQYTVMGYYTSKPGMEALDVPSLKFYSASPECPHKDDPEHRRLGVPGR
jgi:gluconate 2-dehydrogenase gamma chain